MTGQFYNNLYIHPRVRINISLHVHAVIHVIKIILETRLISLNKTLDRLAIMMYMYMYVSLNIV